MVHLPQVAILSFSLIHRDARVLREVKYLSRHFPLTVVGYGQANMPADAPVTMHAIPLPRASWTRKAQTSTLLPLGRLLPSAYDAWYWNRSEYRTALELLVRSRAAVIHANDWNALPAAVRAAATLGARVLLDLHEYSPLEREEQWHWRTFYKPMIDFFLRTYGPRVAAKVTTSGIFAERYAQEYGFRPELILNAPELNQDVPFRPTDPRHIRMVHHGAAMRDRQLERMIEALALADGRYTLHLMLIESSPGYTAELHALARKLAPQRVFFHPPVRPDEIVGRVAEFDLGFYLLPFTNFNNSSSLPNKLFDFVAAGLGVVIGPSREMARLTQQYGFGAVAQSFEPQDAALVLNHLSAADIDHMKRQAIAARQVLNADVEMGKLVELYRRLLG